MKKNILIVLYSSSLLAVFTQGNDQLNLPTKNQVIEQVYKYQDVTRIGFYRDKQSRFRLSLLSQPVNFAPKYELKPVITKLNNDGLQNSSLGNIYSSISGTLIFGQRNS